VQFVGARDAEQIAARPQRIDAVGQCAPTARRHSKGGGGSNMSPSLRMLADDPDVGAVVVITDGAIDFPDEEMPYSVLWALTEPSYLRGQF
jgi:predicted metal-dependent peptidase